MNAVAFLDRRFRAVIVALCAVYLGLELAYVQVLPLVGDEFQGAFSVHQLTTGVPYRDFVPYKTVLGYYLQLPPMLVSGDIWTQVMLVKSFTAVLVAAGVGFVAMRLARLFRPAAVCLALASLVVMSTFLERSGVLRVDMLTGVVGLLSLMALLERRAVWAGALAAASFLVSQKGVYFCLAGGFALAVDWAVRERTRAAAVEAAKFAGAGLATLVVYVVVFGALSSLGGVVRTVFIAHSDIAFDAIYGSLDKYWLQTFRRNPWFYSAAVLGLGWLYAHRHDAERSARNNLLLLYGGAIALLALWHRQPWPYFFVLVIPTLFVLSAAFYESQLAREPGPSRAFWVAYVALALAFPLQRVPTVFAQENGHQRDAVAIAQHVLDDGDGYLAGNEIIYTHPQPSPDLAWLDKRRAAAINKKPANEVIATIEAGRVKLLIWNKRLARLPKRVKTHLSDNYERIHGQIHIYSPTLAAGRFTLAFGGTYEVRKAPPEGIAIDGETVRVHDRLHLTAGAHTASGAGPFRLRLTPDGLADVANPKFKKPKKLFGNPYQY